VATFGQLSAEQRAIVELVLQQGKGYDELSDLLGMPEPRVRELARDALVDLAPLSARGVEEDWRGQLADYVLGQQVGPEVTATRGHLRRSEAARAWTRSLVDSLEQLYPNGELPSIPESERGGRGARGPGAAARGPLVTGTPLELGRQQLALLGAGAVLLLLAILLWPIGVLTGGDDDSASGSGSSSGGTQTQASDQSGGDQSGAGDQTVDPRSQGQAVIFRQGGRDQVLVSATGLAPSTERSAYQVWLYNSEDDRKSMGAQVTDQRGNLQAGKALPQGYRDYRFIDVTEVMVDGQQFRTGRSVLRGLLELRDKPVTRGRGDKRISLLGEIRLLPLPS